MKLLPALAVALLSPLTVFAGTATERLYLSGHGSDDAVPWGFFLTSGRNSGFWTSIRVPSCWEQEGFGTYRYGLEHRPTEKNSPGPEPDEIALYRREFEVPAAWRGRAVRLIFEGVLTDAEVTVNGVSAGPAHQGGFYRFSYDITNRLRWDGENRLEVRVNKHSANASVNRAERTGDYWLFGGIFRPVLLEALPAQHIGHVAIDARADGTFTAAVELSAGLPEAAEVRVELQTLDGKPAAETFTQAVPAGTTRVTVRGRAAQPALWTSETPVLHVAKFSLRTSAGEVHQVEQRFGFRTFEVRPGDGFYLNGSKVIFKGVNRHSFWPDTGRTLSSRRQREDIRLMKEANMNAVRMSHYPPDAEFLDLCDEIGLYVLDELSGWQGSYDTPTGRRLIGEMVRRDVNHPSVLFWDNGNEGGENPENDDEFAKHDPQQRPVLHPWGNFRGINTKHYRNFADTSRLAEGPEIFMPTEFLHGLYDGGHAAGLEDFWKVMAGRPRAAGGFLWVLADEAVARSDEGGRLDARRDWAPDGMVGPHHEKEGSYEAVRQLWSPVQVPLDGLPADFDGRLPVQNRYDFLNLSSCRFEWQLSTEPPVGALKSFHTVLAHGSVRGPDIAPHADGELRLDLPADWRAADVLTLTVFDAQGHALRRWSWQWKAGADSAPASAASAAATSTERDGAFVLQAGRATARIDKTSGRLLSLARDGKPFSLSGPRLAAYQRDNRTFVPVLSAEGTATTKASNDAGSAIVTSRFDGGPFRELRWSLTATGDLRLDYVFTGPGSVELLGVDFDYPEEKMKSKEWLGAGPYRVWQNRLRGTTIARWDVPYNDPVPGESWVYPEFKGWFADWRWIAFTTTEGRFAFLNSGGQPYAGVYSPRDGKINPVLNLPRTGLGVYHVIPAMGTKGSRPDELGPQSQPQTVTGEVRSSLVIRLLDQP